MSKKKQRNRTILVCGRVLLGEQLLIADNLVGPCDTCGHRVQYRPHAPKPFVLRCMECYAELATDDDEHYTTPAMIEDYVNWLRRQQH